MYSIEETRDGYKIQGLAVNEKCECPDNTTEIQNIGNDQVKVIVKKGRIIQS